MVMFWRIWSFMSVLLLMVLLGFGWEAWSAADHMHSDAAAFLAAVPK